MLPPSQQYLPKMMRWTAFTAEVLGGKSKMTCGFFFVVVVLLLAPPIFIIFLLPVVGALLGLFPPLLPPLFPPRFPPRCPPLPLLLLLPSLGEQPCLRNRESWSKSDNESGT